MPKTYYSEYVTHCMRFYARHPEPVFKTRADKKNWTACDGALRQFPAFEREVLLAVYQGGDTVPDNAYWTAKEKGVRLERVWVWIDQLERAIARRRELL